MSALKIAIIGAGPSGCTLARLLLPYSATIHTTIFESDASPDARGQGGTLDLDEKTGQAALKEAGLFDQFLKLARYDSQSFCVTDKNLKKYINIGGGDGNTRGKPEIDRRQLRNMLVDSLPAGMIQWNRRLRQVDEDLNLHFDDGLQSRFDLIVGADGAWSKVRPLLSKDIPTFTGCSGIGFTISNAEEKYPDLHTLVNRGSLLAFSDHRLIMAQQMGDKSLTVGEWTLKSEGWKESQGDVVANIKATKARIAEEYDGWAPEEQGGSYTHWRCGTPDDTLRGSRCQHRYGGCFETRTCDYCGRHFER